MNQALARIGVYEPGRGYGGPVRYVESLLPALVENGFHPVVFSYPRSKLWQHCDRYGHETVSLELKAGVSHGVVHASVDRTGGLQSWIRSGVRTLVPHLVRYHYGFQRDVKNLAAIVSGQGIDLFHSNRGGCEEAPIAARRAGVRHVVGVYHTLPSMDMDGHRQSFVHRRIERRSAKACDQIIAVCEAAKSDWLRRIGEKKRDRVLCVYNGVSIPPTQAERRDMMRDRLGVAKKSVLIGAIGRLWKVKGFDVLLDAICRLQHCEVSAELVIAGDGEDRDALEAQANNLPYPKRVRFVGFTEDVSSLFDSFDIFVLSSHSEALPYVVLEAMAKGLPVVASSVGGVPELVTHNQTGLLVAPRDPIALAEAIRRLALEPDTRKTFGRAGRQRVIQHFHEADMIRKTLEVYRQMLGM